MDVCNHACHYMPIQMYLFHGSNFRGSAVNLTKLLHKFYRAKDLCAYYVTTYDCDWIMIKMWWPSSKHGLAKPAKYSTLY